MPSSSGEFKKPSRSISNKVHYKKFVPEIEGMLRYARTGVIIQSMTFFLVRTNLLLS